MDNIRVGLIGLGTIGAGVAKTLLENTALLEERLGFSLTLTAIADLDITTDRGITIPDGMLTTDARSLINNPDIDIIVELIGGTEPAKTFILEALKSGKHVVTANKALLASHGKELFDAAQTYGKDLYYEAAVGGGIPIIKALRESLVANNYTFIYGILNGTCNYILTEMTEKGSSFKETLKEAMDLGYAEADPTLDVEGIDAAHKLAVITSLAYGVPPEMDKIYVEGISKIDRLDVTYARELGYKVKLLALTIDRGDQVEARVHPTLLPFNYLLSKVDGVFNAFYVRGDIVDSTLFYGRGAGMMPTASAVVSDIADIGRNIRAGIAGRIPHLGYRKDLAKPKKYMDIDDICTNYYLRINVADKPGVLAKIAGILGERDISIVSVIQKAPQEKGFVPIVMLTHEARESNIRSAIREIESLEEVGGSSVVMRVEDKDLKNKRS
ncbi:MAG TPA: homoserine dehydrogenase [Deltaproteobacteria bacterium]|nr:homoserine dehydrogenase [Deltaproteobacteria bacterium]HPJ94368.1 homoserine dehydrogenase [Deltaproteobacteria bacterium]HPR50512.1 homoserine dehydrogenase [Deltaproteobacteria bacterium]